MEYSVASLHEPASASSSNKVAAQQALRARLHMWRYSHNFIFSFTAKYSRFGRWACTFIQSPSCVHTHTHTCYRMVASGIMQKWHFVAQQNKVSLLLNLWIAFCLNACILFSRSPFPCICLPATCSHLPSAVQSILSRADSSN